MEEKMDRDFGEGVAIYGTAQGLGFPWIAESFPITYRREQSQFRPGPLRDLVSCSIVWPG